MARRGRRGEGTVYYSRSDRRWVARWPLGVVKGRRIAKRVKCPTERAARAELERLRRTYGSGIAPVHETLDAYLERWLASHRGIEPSTHRSYADHVRLHISPLLGGILVARLQAADVDRLIADRLRAKSKRGGTLSASTVARIITTLRIALGRGYKRGELPINAAAMVTVPKRAKRQLRAMPKVEGDRITEALADHWAGPVVRLMLGSGLRLGEALSLNQGDLFLDEGFVRLRTSKTTLRAVPISEDAVDALRALLAATVVIGDGEPVFLGPRTGRRLTGSSVSHALPRELVRLGIVRAAPHGLRHGAASIMLAGGASLSDIGEQLGHKSLTTTRQYAHVLPERQRQAVKHLPGRSQAR